MKRLISSLIGILSLVSLAVTPMASAATTWAATISKLPAYTTSHSFNVQYTILSTESQSFTVQLQQSNNGESFTDCGAAQLTTDDPNPNAANGNSGSVPACVTADGSYSFRFLVTPNEQASEPTATTSTTVDSVGPAAPTYSGKTQSGNTYVLSFSAPSTADVSTIQVFASTGKTYQAGESTRVGNLSASPNQSFSFSYTAPDSATRFFAIEAFDAAGNGSPTVGDPGTVVNPVRFVSQGGQGGGTAGTAGAQTASAGSVLGATTTGNGSGHVNAPGTSQTKKNGKVLGAATTTGNSTTAKWFAGIGSAVIILAILYYWLYGRSGSFPFKPGK